MVAVQEELDWVIGSGPGLQTGRSQASCGSDTQAAPSSFKATRRRFQLLSAYDDPPEYWVVLRESALQVEVGGRGVMREQLQHIAEFAQRPGMTVQVLPNSHGAHPSMITPFMILNFDLAPDFSVVYMDDLTGSLYRDEPEEVDRYHRAYRHLIKAALPEPQSLELINRTVKDLYS